MFNLRIGDISELNTWLPVAKLRPHVVLKLLFALVDAKFPFCNGSRTAHHLKERFRVSTEERDPETESHLPEDERDGKVPTLV